MLCVHRNPERSQAIQGVGKMSNASYVVDGVHLQSVKLLHVTIQARSELRFILTSEKERS